MLKASDLISSLHTGWTSYTSTISEPEMQEGRINEASRKFPSVYVRVGNANTVPASINSTALIVNTPFEIECIGKSDDDITDLVNVIHQKRSESLI